MWSVYVKLWSFEVSASVLLVCEEVEDFETGYLQSVLAVMCSAGEEVEDVDASYSEGVAERSGDPEVEDHLVEFC